MRSRLVPLFLTLAVVAAACDAGGSASAGESQAGLAASDVARAAADAPAPDVAAAVAGNRAFAADAYAVLTPTADGNLVFSPASIRLALAMTWAGADGATAEQMAAALHFDLAPDDMHAALNAVDALLASRNREEPPGPDGAERTVVLTIANALWGQAGFTFLPGFLDTLARDYGAGMRLVDFVADAEAARVQINGWVADMTSDRIPELIPAGVLSDLTRLVLTNTVYFNASWDRPFDDALTADGPFTLLDGSVVTAPTMHASEAMPYAAGDGWQAVEIPYVGGELAMLVLVPDVGRFAEVEGSLAAVLDEARDDASRTDVALGLPSWEFRTQAGLVPVLQALGMTDAFDPALADFTPMTGARDLFVSDVLHEAFISVDEAGTEAAAATAVIMDLRAAMPGDTVELEIDRPFLFAIQDTASGEILFLGRVLDPTA
ncbi:MAG: serpin family protein [Actinobacteria bacterium]|nr:serpin family protein [Actinomycetota bacterium]